MTYLANLEFHTIKGPLFKSKNDEFRKQALLKSIMSYCIVETDFHNRAVVV